MSVNAVEDRLIEIEKRVDRLERELADSHSGAQPWWRRVAGRFKDNPEFDEAVRLGREYRQSLPIDDAESA